MDEQKHDDKAPSDASSESTNNSDSAGVGHAVAPQGSESGTEPELPSHDDATASPPTPSSPGWRPSEYYAAPRSARTLPRWVPLTCGVAAILAIGLMAITGAFLQAGGLAKLVAFALGQMHGEAEGLFDDGVAPDARAAFKKSLLAVRDGVDDGTIELQSALPLLQAIQKATSDRRLSEYEVEELTGTFEKSLAKPTADDAAEPPTVDL